VTGAPSQTPASEPHPLSWTSTFDRIKDTGILQTLHDHQKDWTAVFRSSGKSAEQLSVEANLELQRLRNQIASDDSLLRTNAPGPAIVPTAAQCKAANNGDPLSVLCDRQLREDQVLAISGMLELLPHYANLLPPAVHSGSYGRQPGKEIVSKVTIRVVAPPAPNPAILNLAAPDAKAYIVTPADNKRTIEVQQDQSVIVRFAANKQRSPGFVLTPTAGVLEAPPGTVHYPTDRYIVFTAVKPGTATIEFTGPLVAEINGSEGSYNWSGYVTLGQFYGVQGSWVVPQIITPLGGESATWVGLDGFGEPQLIQAGTEQDYSNGFLGIGGGASYYAWWEILPQVQQPISNPVYPGDAMLVSIFPVPGTSVSANNTSYWQIELTNLTRKWTFITKRNFTGPLDTADWIEEDPSTCLTTNCLTPFANYGQVVFDFYNRVALSNPEPPDFSPVWTSPYLNPSQNSTEVLSIAQSVFSTPSAPDADQDGFYVTYTQWGPNQVAPPAPWIVNTTLPPMLLNQPFSQALIAFVEDNPFDPNGPSWSWSLVTGALPNGLSLDPATGTISGTPTQTGTFNFSVLATDKVTGAFSQTNNFAAIVTSQPAALLTLQCGPFTPPVPGAGFALTFRNAPVPCNSTFQLDPGTYSVTATPTGLNPNDPYEIIIGGACNSAGQVTLTQGQVASCAIQAESVHLVVTAGCKLGQRCCEPGDHGCQKCISSNLSCP